MKAPHVGVQDTAAEPEAGPATPTRKVAPAAAIYSLYLIAFTVQLGMGIVSPILPEIMREFSLSGSQTAMMVTVFGLARLLTDVPLALLLDRANRTATLVLGTLLIVVGSAASANAEDYSFLLMARLAMGMGSALCTVTALYSLSHAAGAESRGRVIGMYQSVVLAGATFSPAIGGIVASVAGWRSSFLFCAFAASAAMLLVLVASGRGQLASAAGSGHRQRPGEVAAVEEEEGGIPWGLVAINYTSLVLFVSMAGFRNSMVPLYGGTELGIGTASLGLMMGASAILRSFVTAGSGYASDRYGRKAVLIPGMLFLAAGTLGFPLARDWVGFALCLFILSWGGFGNSVPTTMVVDAVKARRVGFAISVNRFVGDAGILVGPVALGWVLDVAGFPVVAVLTAGLLLSSVPVVMLAVRGRPGKRE